MAFFTRKHKQLAKKLTDSQLNLEYRLTEAKLKECASKGDIRGLKKAMQKHGDYEYAMLLKRTPKFNKKKGGRL